MSDGDYVEVSRLEALERARDSRYMSAAHTMFYAESRHKFLGKYECKYCVLMQMRFDGTLGFAGGMIDEGESPEQCVTREFQEEIGCGEAGRSPVVFAEQDHVMSHYSDHTHMCLHFYAKEVSHEVFTAIESGVTRARHWGDEVLGIVRCPLYTLPNGLGLPAFLSNHFIGHARKQLLLTLERRGLLSAQEVREAEQRSTSVNGMVTAEETDY